MTGFCSFIFFSVIAGEECDWQLFQHYEQKGCRAVLGRNGCPLKFHCEQLSDEDLRSKCFRENTMLIKFSLRFWFISVS